MGLKRHAVLLVCFLMCLFLDTAVLPRWNLFHLVPFAMLALMLATVRTFSFQSAILIGSFGGLLEDLLCENMIGLTSALCLLSAVILQLVIRDKTAKPFFVFLGFALLALFVDGMRALVALLVGMRFGLMPALLYSAIPRALLTGLWGMVFLALFKPLLKGQVDAS